MTFEQALAIPFESICAEYCDATIYIKKDESLWVIRELQNGKTECEMYYTYEMAKKDYPLNKLYWRLCNKR